MTPTKFTGVYYRDTKNDDRIFYITYKLKGKLYREKIGSNKEGVSASYASKIRAKRTSIDRLKEDAPMHKIVVPTFDEAFNMYMNKIEGKSDTNNQKQRYELHVKPFFGEHKLDDITTEMLEDFKRKSKTLISSRTNRPYASKTINDWLDIISTVYNYMKTNQDLDIKNPAHNAKLQREKVDNDRERYLDLDEIEKLWKSIEDRKGDEEVTYRLKLFVALSLSTGARLRSVMTISKSDINLQQDTIIIKNHKSNRTYTGFLHQNWKELIENRMKELRPIDYIVSGTPQEIVRSVIGRNLQPLLEQFNEGIDIADTKRRVVIHSLRHTFASLLAIQGTPIYTIMRLMDHADISQTIRYAKLSPDSAKDSVKQLKFK